MDYYFTGTVERIIFENASNFFKILLLELTDTDSDFAEAEIIIKGTMADIIEGDAYTFWGPLIQHPKYGQQVALSRYEKAKPSAQGLVTYFASKHFKGIGQKTAEKIIALYGSDPIDKILKDPSKLEAISGLSKANREAFLTKLRINYGTEQIIAGLIELGVTNRQAFDIYDHYKEEAIERVTSNPYGLVEEVPGIGFKLADQLAKSLGIASDAPQRLRAALLHTLLERSLTQGNTYIEARDLLEYTIILLEEARPIECQPEAVASALNELIQEEKVYNRETRIFDASLFYAEEGIKNHIKRLLTTPLDTSFSQDQLSKAIERVQTTNHLVYDQVQKNALLQALNSKVFILTGGPGTGKTTVIKGLLEAYAHLHDLDLHQKDLPIILAAPTGRAARRMNELTGLASATIHRHLGLNGDNDYQALDEYLDCDLLIVDEFSMVDTWLANQLLAAVASNTQVIIVGDSDQLPSVGPGQVLADLLQVPAIPQLALQKIFRQSADSTIVELANHMRQGHLPGDFTAKKADRSYFEAQAAHIPEMVTKIVSAALKSGIPAEEIQLLAPNYKGLAGINNLNSLLQELINPYVAGDQFTFNDLTFRKGDKVLHLVNDAQANVFNGDIGYITDLIPGKYTESKQDELVLTFEGAELTYPRSEWLKITLAYAMSIHKAQGSEFQVVILPITRQSGRLLQRNLLYTAVTRSKSKLILLGEYQAFAYAVSKEGDKRQTYLVERFQALKDQETAKPQAKKGTPREQASSQQRPFAKENQDYRLTSDNLMTIDPMIGLTDEDILSFFEKNIN
ncbi:ATP-dependent RecD-like DNA helicase [Streptococcus halichoeri]|uniref:SF1B family DNA helicase RecD2 n=1 Tax=Streptococcus halichoeri TaxID=254785 RepID=UPI00135B82C6|nr:ATP-dependent RecD-like DNA helicase [Streptococcus halichoeri]